MFRTLPQRIRDKAVELGMTGDPSAGRALPSINDPLPQLGKLLFFSKSLSGNRDVACATCHHPALGGGDRLSLPVGSGAVQPNLVGLGRRYAAGPPVVPRNAPTTFNIALYDKGLFWDSRVESLGKVAGANGAGSGIRTPDSPFGVADVNAGPTLPAAQASFPVTVASEMRGDVFEAGNENAAVRAHLAARIGGYGVGAGELPSNRWLEKFQAAFGSSAPAEELITFENIALAIAEYERSQVFVDSPWRHFMQGDDKALSEDALKGAAEFFGDPPGGLGCARCHNGVLFTDEDHHAVAFPQFGPGKGDGDEDDFGRGRETAQTLDLYRFRTPSLLNVAVTGPYGHAGVYSGLAEVLRHYIVPSDAIDEFFLVGACGTAQFKEEATCASLFPKSESHTAKSKGALRLERQADPDGSMPDIDTTNFDPIVIEEIHIFLRALTDPCVENRACLAPWIPTPAEDPDGNQLNAVGADGQPL